LFCFLLGNETDRDVDCLAEVVDLVEGLPLLFVLRDDPFAAVFIWYALFVAQLIEQLPAADTEFGFERGWTVVDSRVYDLWT
jgi:hypothetical protein